MGGIPDTEEPSPPWLDAWGGKALRGGVATLVIVWPCGESVDAYAAAGREVVVPRAPCPSCGVPMSFRSGYWRYVRQGVGVRIFVARSQCRWCDGSHGLLPDFCLVGRLDTVEVIGAAVARAASGAGARPAAEEAGVPHTTARDWRRRHRRRAPVLAAGFAALAVAVDGTASVLAPEPERASLEALGAAWDAARCRLGGRTPPVLRFCRDGFVTALPARREDLGRTAPETQISHYL